MSLHETMQKLPIYYIRCFWNEEVLVYSQDAKPYLAHCKTSYCTIHEK